MPAVDVDGLFLRLSALSEQAEALPLMPEPRWEPATEAPDADEGWRERVELGLTAAWQRLSRYIRIQRRDVPPEVLLEPATEQLVRFNLERMLGQARLALLQGRTEPYRQSLEQAQRSEERRVGKEWSTQWWSGADKREEQRGAAAAMGGDGRA